MKINLLAATAITLAIPLGGCANFLDFGFRSTDTQRAEADRIDMSDYFEQRLADGRNHLRAGRLAGAIDAFRQASYHPATAAEAANGLGIAYDRLGRSDLAKIHFEKALSIAPEEPRYHRNLAKFEGKELRVELAAKPAPERLAQAPKPTPAATEKLDLTPTIVEANAMPNGKSQASTASRERKLAEVSLDTASIKKTIALEPVEAAQIEVRSPAPVIEIKVAEARRPAAEQELPAKPATRIVSFEGTAPKSPVRVFDPRTSERNAGVTLVRVSRNEVRIGRADVEQPAGTVTVHSRTAQAIAPGGMIHTGVAIDTAEAQPGPAGALSLSPEGSTSPTPLALAETWKACKSGC